MPENKPAVQIYCDGACLGNPGPGGWATLLLTSRAGKEHERVISGGETLTTNNRMELRAAIEGFKALKRSCSVSLYSDSQYVVKGMKEWIFGWQKNNWKNAARKPIENQDLWQELLQASSDHQVKWHWVKGHAGHPQNERVDEVAREEAEKAASFAASLG